MIVSDLSAQVNDLLRPMGITRNVSAYSILLRCIELIYEQENSLQAVEEVRRGKADIALTGARVENTNCEFTSSVSYTHLTLPTIA